MIAVGDISKWSKGAVGFRYPEPKNRVLKRSDAEPIPSLPLGKKVVINAQEPPCCVDGISKGESKKERTGDEILKTVGFSNKASMVFESLVTRRFFT